MPADFSGRCLKPGFWVWAKREQEIFWFHDTDSPAYWREAWDRTHGEGVYVPLDGDYFTPKLKLDIE